MIDGHCPRCSQVLHNQNYSTGYAICSCGWFETRAERRQLKKTEKDAIKAMAVFATIFVLGFAHLLNWSHYSAQVPLLTIQSITGTLSADDERNWALACVELNKWERAEELYRDLFSRTSDPSALADLAHLQARLGETAKALTTYSSYVTAHGHDSLTLLRYGQLLETSGRGSEAIEQFEASIAADPERLPVQATSGIVKVLSSQGRFAEAYERIKLFHESAGNAQGYLNTELAELSAHLRGSGNSMSGKSKHARHRSGEA